ncbi:hypothetical protein T492DRAFT_439866 [Pavlovales sp. CCMP2436]|nr:hypothetical protein T492DRAFT_439866 [Pavlovales sp. CCMP2436]
MAERRRKGARDGASQRAIDAAAPGPWDSPDDGELRAAPNATRALSASPRRPHRSSLGPFQPANLAGASPTRQSFRSLDASRQGPSVSLANSRRSSPQHRAKPSRALGLHAPSFGGLPRGADSPARRARAHSPRLASPGRRRGSSPARTGVAVPLVVSAAAAARSLPAPLGLAEHPPPKRHPPSPRPHAAGGGRGSARAQSVPRGSRATGKEGAVATATADEPQADVPPPVPPALNPLPDSLPVVPPISAEEFHRLRAAFLEAASAEAPNLGSSPHEYRLPASKAQQLLVNACAEIGLGAHHARRVWRAEAGALDALAGDGIAASPRASLPRRSGGGGASDSPRQRGARSHGVSLTLSEFEG